MQLHDFAWIVISSEISAIADSVVENVQEFDVGSRKYRNDCGIGRKESKAFVIHLCITPASSGS